MAFLKESDIISLGGEVVAVGLINIVHSISLGSEDSSVVEQQTDDQKVSGLSPGKSGRILFFPRYVALYEVT